MLIYIEVKDEVGNHDLWQKVLKTVRNHKVEKQAAVLSFNTEMACHYKSEAADIAFGAIIGSKHASIVKNQPLYAIWTC